MLTPATVHAGRAADVLAARHTVMHVAFKTNPDRFAAGEPARALLPSAG